jgi:N-carbamoyl-L-amino-acid hydrolase
LTLHIPVDADRLWKRHLEMAQIGAIEGGGVNRPSLSAADCAARALLADWAAARGFAVFVDPIGNLFVRRNGSEPFPAILTGSHMDTQPVGGRFDGMYGVLAGLEALEALEDAGIETLLPVEVVVWTNEEGARFDPGCMGSMCFAGVHKPEDFRDVEDAEGVTFGSALNAALAALPHAIPRDFGPPPAAFIEAHIEQGPVLERAGKVIGIVSGIQGARWFDVLVHGRAAHAGTTPLAARHDALREAVAMITALQAAFHDPTDTVRFTVGKVDVTPNSPNCIAERVLFTVDLRHPDAGMLQALAGQVETICRQQLRYCQVEVKETFTAMACKFDPWIMTLIGQQAGELDLPSMVLPSGAFHDALFLQRITPTGMVFVPCADGISHDRSENASPADLAAGCRVLAGALLALAS